MTNKKHFDPDMLKLAKNWFASYTYRKICGIELDDVYNEIYLAWLEKCKPASLNELGLCNLFYRIARRLGYRQDNGLNYVSDEVMDCYEFANDNWTGLEEVFCEFESVSLYVSHAAEIELIEDELDRLHDLKSTALSNLLRISPQHSRLVRSKYENAIAQRCKDKISLAAKRQKANRGA